MNYQQQALAVMNGLELVVSLYDGMTRFLYRAIACVHAEDVAGRRDAIRRVLDILTYLQARLRTDIGGESATVLAEFYAAMYAQCVRASRDASIPLLEKSIREIMNVRDAWKQASARETTAPQPTANDVSRSFPSSQMSISSQRNPNFEEAGSRCWSA